MYCRIHPRYKVKRQPSGDCPTCWYLWSVQNPYATITLKRMKDILDPVDLDKHARPTGGEYKTKAQRAAEEKAWREEEKKRHAIMDKVDNKVEAYLHKRGIDNPIMTWCCEYDEADTPIDNLDDIAIVGKCVVYSDDGKWTGGGPPYYSNVLENPTWLELCYEFDMSRRVNEDGHHVYFEGIKLKNKKREGVAVYEMCSGS